MAKKISRDTPLSELTLRRYEKPNVSNRELVRKLCLSVGLLQPGDSRDVVVDILHTLLKSRKTQEQIDSEEIRSRVIQSRKDSNLPILGIAASNVRRQLKRLKDLHFIEANANLYRVVEFSPLLETFSERVEKYMLRSIMDRVKDYLKRVDEEF